MLAKVTGTNTSWTLIGNIAQVKDTQQKNLINVTWRTTQFNGTGGTMDVSCNYISNNATLPTSAATFTSLLPANILWPISIRYISNIFYGFVRKVGNTLYIANQSDLTGTFTAANNTTWNANLVASWNEMTGTTNP